MSLPSQLRIFAPPGAVGPFGFPCPSSGALAYQGPGVTGRLGGTGSKVMKDPPMAFFSTGSTFADNCLFFCDVIWAKNKAALELWKQRT